MTSYTAQLRVYEPFAAFAPAERAFWETYAGHPANPADEHVRSLRALAARPPRLVADGAEHALVTVVDGVTLVCPWRTAVRSAQALLDYRAGLPHLVADAFHPAAAEQAAGQLLADWRSGHPEQHVHVLDSTWQVPLRWFVLVDDSERQVRAGRPDRRGRTAAGRSAGAASGQRVARALAYRTPMSRARRRLARGLSVLRRTMPDAAATGWLEDLGRWLEDFHPRSLVELDYGALVHLLDDDQLEQDRSAHDVAEALAALADGRGQDAGVAYGRVVTRMKALQAVESAN